ncbi:MAG: DUF177 domain-containing protein [Candidatus Omnitrophica bacterium]|nr:DUF177 domain-containing protein [Candidatus Omnitrophota bacterium]
MKIEINKIPLEGLTLEEESTAAALDLETDIINFKGSIKIAAGVSKITNAVTVRVALDALMHTSCSRCLDEFEIKFKKKIALNYPVEKAQLVIDTSTSLSVNGERSRTIDLDPDIREEIILDYPIKPLCKPDCQGLCLKCGRNLNEGKCNC